MNTKQEIRFEQYIYIVLYSIYNYILAKINMIAALLRVPRLAYLLLHLLHQELSLRSSLLRQLHC